MKIANTRIRTTEGSLLLGMLTLDVAFLGMNFLHHYTSILPDTRYAIQRQAGFGEIFQYAKELICVLLLLSAGYRCRLNLLLLWGALFLYLFVTDAFRINEQVAGWLLHHVFLPFGLKDLRASTLKLGVFSFAGLVFVGCIGFHHIKVRAEGLREDSAVLARLVTLFLLFGVVVDYIHQSLKGGSTAIYNLFGIIEEWGEMLVMSLIVMAVYLCFIRALRSHPHHSKGWFDRWIPRTVGKKQSPE